MAIEQLIFYGFACLVTGSGLMMILSRNPVKSALFLVLALDNRNQMQTNAEDQRVTQKLIKNNYNKEN